MGRAPTNVKENLIETAIDLIWRSSYAAVSVDDICKKADAQKGSFYYYFPSKADLALAALNVHFERDLPDEGTFKGLDDSPLAQLYAMLDWVKTHQQEVAQTYGRVCGCPFATLGSEIAGQHDGLNDRINEIMAFFTLMIKDVIASAQDAGEISKSYDAHDRANAIHGYVMGMMTIARIQNDLSVIDDMKPVVMSMLGITDEKAVAA